MTPTDSPNHDPLCFALWIGVLLEPSAKLFSALERMMFPRFGGMENTGFNNN
jgi:hypothetical protein